MSFSSETKDYLCESIMLKNIERRFKESLLSGLLINSAAGYVRTDNINAAEIIINLISDLYSRECLLKKKKHYVIETDIVISEKNTVYGDCLRYFITGMFLICGQISTPEKAYLLEFTLKDEDKARFADRRLKSAGFAFKTAVRAKNHIIYIKESELIEDFLFYIGAKASSFKIADVKIYKELKNNINRTMNFENANMKKTSSVAAKQIKAIKRLIELNMFDELTDDLKETAKLRLENIELSLSELSELTYPQITKSGINHRLNRIIKIYEDVNGKYE